MVEAEQHDTLDYDAFISYARFDEHLGGFVAALAAKMREIFRSQTGRKLRLFVDSESIPSASLWEKRILVALSASATLIAVQTPSYLTSEWCGCEWDTFLILERERREGCQLLPDESLIFPILLAQHDNLMSYSDDIYRRAAELQQRQSIDLSGVEPNSDECTIRVTRLVGDLVATLRKVIRKELAQAGLTPKPGSYERYGLAVTTPR